MPTPINKALASRAAAVCRMCEKDLPRNAFFPSVFGRYDRPVCRSCESAKDAQQQAQQRETLAQRLRDAFASRPNWTAIEAADFLGWQRHTAGSRLEALRVAGLIERVDTGMYRFPAATIPQSPVAEVVVKERPQPAQNRPASTFPPVLHVGLHFINVDRIVYVEYDDRGKASVVLTSQETRPNGHTAPVTLDFAGEEAAQLMAQVSLMRGVVPVELSDRIAKLEAALHRAEQDRDAALALAEERERELSRIYAVVSPRRSAA